MCLRFQAPSFLSGKSVFDGFLQYHESFLNRTHCKTVGAPISQSRGDIHPIAIESSGRLLRLRCRRPIKAKHAEISDLPPYIISMARSRKEDRAARRIPLVRIRHFPTVKVSSGISNKPGLIIIARRSIARIDSTEKVISQIVLIRDVPGIGRSCKSS